jgi:hypothetical protein
MRIAAIAAYEAGIRFVPVHDAFWIMAPLDELDAKITQMAAIMERASHAVCGSPSPSRSHVVKYPQCLGDVRGPKNKGHKMWLEVQADQAGTENGEAAAARKLHLVGGPADLRRAGQGRLTLRHRHDRTKRLPHSTTRLAAPAP